MGTVITDIFNTVNTSSFTYETKSFGGNEFGVFKGLAAPSNTYSMTNDRFLTGCWQRTIEERRKLKKSYPLLLQHAIYSHIGQFDATETDEGLIIEARMLLRFQNTLEVFEKIRCGDYNTLSVGFLPYNSTSLVKNNRGAYDYKEAQLFEVSIVTFGDFPQTQVLEVGHENNNRDLDRKSIKTKSISDFLAENGYTNNVSYLNLIGNALGNINQ